MIRVIGKNTDKLNGHLELSLTYFDISSTWTYERTAVISINNPFVERVCKLLDNLKPLPDQDGIILTDDYLSETVTEGNISADEYDFLSRILFNYYSDQEMINYFGEENCEYATEFYECVSNETEQRESVYFGWSIWYIDRETQKNITFYLHMNK